MAVCVLLNQVKETMQCAPFPINCKAIQHRLWGGTKWVVYWR